MSSRKIRLPTHKENPPYRRPTIVENPGSYDSLGVRIRFDLLDFDHPKWGWDKVTQEQYLEFLRFLQKIEKMTWAEVKVSPKGGTHSKGNKHHSIEIHKFPEEVHERLNKLNLQKVLGDKLFSMRVGGVTRIYGGRDGEYFRPIWYDPLHTIYRIET